MTHYPSPCDTAAWIGWYLDKNPTASHADATAFTLGQVERQIGCNVGARVTLLDSLRMEMAKADSLDILHNRIDSILHAISTLDTQDEVARNFLIEHSEHKTNPLYSTPRAQYEKEKRGRMEWLRENRHSTVRAQMKMAANSIERT